MAVDPPPVAADRLPDPEAKFCPQFGLHGPHEWNTGVRRYACPGVPVSAAVSPAEPPDGETLDALRWSLLKAMGDWSEGTYAAGWMSGTEEMLHEQGGIWEILGCAVGWPTGYEHDPDFRWVSWDEAGAIFAERKVNRGY